MVWRGEYFRIIDQIVPGLDHPQVIVQLAKQILLVLGVIGAIRVRFEDIVLLWPLS